MAPMAVPACGLDQATGDLQLFHQDFGGRVLVELFQDLDCPLLVGGVEGLAPPLEQGGDEFLDHLGPVFRACASDVTTELATNWTPKSAGLKKAIASPAV